MGQYASAEELHFPAEDDEDVDLFASYEEEDEEVTKLIRSAFVGTVLNGIKQLQIDGFVEDEKDSLDELQAEIEEDEDDVQSTDMVAMQKL
ncbi:hypothetical protein DL767_008190 [Monosporascus sp. MG133]|nr:hypothetical protein DL767_008190 [Monosporascus sp. MG133]